MFPSEWIYNSTENCQSIQIIDSRRRDIKECILRKKIAFRSGDTAAIKAAEKELNQQLRKAGRQRKEHAEQFKYQETM